MSKPPQTAAIVNGDPIYESDVTSFIEGFRMKNIQYETDTSWAEFLRSNGYTSENVRSYVLETVFIPKHLIRQECSKRDIRVLDAELNKVIESEKAYYEQRYGDNSWDSVLASYGYDEKSWRQNEHDRLLEEELRRTVIGEVSVSDAEFMETVLQSASTYNGKSSYYIAFDSQQLAQAAYDRIGSHSSFSEFEKLGQPVWAGWNSLPEMRDQMSSEYVSACNGLNVDDISAPFFSNGQWIIVYCDATFNFAPKEDSAKPESLPQDIYDQLMRDARNSKSRRLFNDWLDELEQNSEILIMPMPSGLPYSVNVTISD